jgi:hypothetical protein
MAVKWGVAFGCEVYVISRSRAKEADALRLGAKVGGVGLSRVAPRGGGAAPAAAAPRRPTRCGSAPR